jgi:hypothetical protein
MKSKHIFLLTSFLFLTILQTNVKASNVNLNQNKSNQEIDLIESLLIESDRAFNQEDLKAVMDLMHPDSPIGEDLQKIYDYSFNLYDFDYQNDSFEVLTISKSEATIRVTQTAKKISGPEFTDNQTISIQSLKKHNGQWKFFNLLQVEEIKYLN